MDKEAKRILIILISIIALFLSLIIYLTWFQTFKAGKVKDNSYNKRLWINEEKIIRGTIMDKNDTVLAYSEKNGLGSKRIYNYGNLYSHLIGYSYREYGKTGLELEYNRELLGLEDNSTINEIKDMIVDEKRGNSLKLTLDHGLQEKLRQELMGNKGAGIVLNPKTGEIYAMVSLPDFNVSNLKEEWKNISIDENSPLLNRASQGLYEPGSSFKIVTAASILENKIDTDYKCEGSIVVDGYKFKDYSKKGHGNLNLNKALTKSCNTYFVHAASILGKDRLGKTADKFLINKEIPFDLPTSKSSFKYKENIKKTEVAASGIGQGRLLLTPLNISLITSTIANNGLMMEPYLVRDLISPEGQYIKKTLPKELSRPISEETARTIKDAMVNAVDVGTGKNVKIKGVSVGGKTGTAENNTGKNHTWFTGFAPAENPEFVVTVVLESSGGTGGGKAGPIAKRLLEYSLKNIN